jgi:hypothetical protein
MAQQQLDLFYFATGGSAQHQVWTSLGRPELKKLGMLTTRDEGQGLFFIQTGGYCRVRRRIAAITMSPVPIMIHAPGSGTT